MASSHGTSRTRVVMEIFSRTGSASKRAPSFGFTAAAPLDSSVGVVLGSDDGKALCNRMIGSLRPLVLLPGIHCAPWLVMNGNMNYSRRSEELQELRADERPNLEAAMDWCVQQHAEGRQFLFQSPVTSRIWAEDCVANMLRKTNGRWSDCHSRDYGGKDSQGNPTVKSLRFASNNPILLSFWVYRCLMIGISAVLWKAMMFIRMTLSRPF